jgi:hypothetical protein
MEQDDVQDRSIPEGLIQERAVGDPVFIARGITEVTRDLFEEINSNTPTVANLPPLDPQEFTRLAVQAPPPAPAAAPTRGCPP